MSSNVLKQTTPTGEKEAVPFKEWVAAHKSRIPGRSVEIPEEEQEKHSRPGYNYRQVIDGTKTRVANRRVSVNMLLSSPLDIGDRASPETSATEVEKEFPFGLTEEQYHELRATWTEERRPEIEERISRARSEAYEEGYEAAAAEVEEEIRALREILTAAMDRIESKWSTFLERTEPLLGKLAFDIAERILDAPLPEEIYAGVTAAIHDAVDELSGETRTDITLHPADFIRLKETGLLEQLELVDTPPHAHLRL
jgi:flagellar biosynthesis/type III secretory pathway protein FliH